MKLLSKIKRRNLNSLLHLKQGVTKYGPAPHKPVLLLAVIDMFETGQLEHNWIEVSGELVIRFQDWWKLLVSTNHSPTFALPFYHLSNEPNELWKLVLLPGKEMPLTRSHSIKSFKALNETVAAARLSPSFYKALVNPVEREKIKQAILEKYFPDKVEELLEPVERYSAMVEKQIMWDPSENYVRKVHRIIEPMSNEEKEQELMVRSTLFKKAIRSVYDHRCAMSGMQIQFRKNVSMVDACHIIPFAETFNDTIRNGIALTPTLHRAFDRGLVAISDDYTVLVHKEVHECSSNYTLQQFASQPLLLPCDEQFYPDLNLLREHRQRFGF
ncbi:HNH endonuclease [Marinilabiliaceae bacterium JC017]|nr:HNH endonuclease [Marinilabiliaceae bacterium JC017]